MNFLELHTPGEPLLLANAWDVGSARLLESLGYKALATTSSGFAATLGRLDGDVTRDEAVDHGAELANAVSVPVSADLEHGYAEDAAGVAETVRRAKGAGLAGGSIEDYSGERLYEREEALERVQAAVEAAGDGFVLTARAENFIRGNPDLDDTIARLTAFAEAGAHVLYAPGLSDSDHIRAVVQAVAPKPVNVLALPNAPTVSELAGLGVARISVGGGFAFAAYGAMIEGARQLLEQGTTGFWVHAATGSKATKSAFRA